MSNIRGVQAQKALRRGDMEKRKYNFKYIYAVIFCLAVFVLGLFGGVPTVSVRADESGIPDDFAGTALDFSDYPVIADDYSVQVIQIAEDINNGLVVYVYQPSVGRKLLATTIRFSTSIGMNAEFRDRVLEYEGSTGTIYKYKVKDFNILGDALRYYLVAAIHRESGRTDGRRSCLSRRQAVDGKHGERRGFVHGRGARRS